MIAVLILIPVVGFALFFFACYKTDWKAIDEQNRLTCPKIALHSNNYKKCTSYD